ncbi:MAG: hypothetical protein JW965_06825 [Bacteroidales bacterium]|nr:hypothetical protein [Bacteroidales bacterium]
MKNKKSIYTDNVKKYRSLLDRTGKKLLYLSLLRLLDFISGVILLVLLWKISQLAAIGVFVAAIIIFIVLLKKYSDLSFKKSFYENLLLINEKEIKGLNDDHSCFDGGDEYTDLHHDFSHDIDLFGRDSLFQYLNRTCTGRGKKILAEWLMAPYKLCSQIGGRQEAIRELAGMLQWRHEFNAYGMMGITDEPTITDFTSWLKEKPGYLNNRTYNVLRFLMPAITLCLFVLTVTCILHYSILILFFLINLGIISINLKEINNIHARVTRKHSMFKTLSNLIMHFEDQKFSSGFINDLKKVLSADDKSASQSIVRLSKILQAFDSRLNMLMAVPLNGFLLWDIQCINRLELWKKSVSDLLPQWFHNLGQADALCSMANFACNNTNYCHPVVSEGNEYLSSIKLGHPLIPEKTRVCNDFTISRKGEINIITGANMAGKSTFLRTVAVNLVLAMTGAPVCAYDFTFTPCNVYSSMRTTDSLSDSESYFYAELKRLRALKERLENNENIFFLLDEILKGTNSEDKSRGSQMFIEKIIKYDATGIVATHDILLGKLGNRHNSIRNRCFEIEIEGDEVKFDYILRDGMTTKMNAAILMTQMGII